MDFLHARGGFAFFFGLFSEFQQIFCVMMRKALCRFEKGGEKMKKTMKTVGAVLCAILVLTMSVLPLCAASVPQPDVEPMWENTSMISCILSFPNGVGNASSIVTGYPEVTCVKIDVYIYRLAGNGIWTRVTEDHSISYDRRGGIECTFIAVRNINYRADFLYTVTKDGVDEVIRRTAGF